WTFAIPIGVVSLFVVVWSDVLIVFHAAFRFVVYPVTLLALAGPPFGPELPERLECAVELAITGGHIAHEFLKRFVVLLIHEEALCQGRLPLRSVASPIPKPGLHRLSAPPPPGRSNHSFDQSFLDLVARLEMFPHPPSETGKMGRVFTRK